ncbi:MAG: transglycosylase SLT domain-containing protein, partial [Nocardioidaceae bacterium]
VGHITDPYIRRQLAIANALQPLTSGAPYHGGPVVDYVRRAAAGRGWTGGQWQALYQLLMSESGFDPHADNPKSSAHGIFQFLDSTRASYGIPFDAPISAQTRAGLDYVGNRYTTPAHAWAFKQAHGWYDQGGVWPSGTVGINRSGAPEAVLTGDQWRSLRTIAQSVTGPRVMSAAPAGGDGAAQPLIGELNVTTTPQASAGEIIGEALHQTRVVRAGRR